MDKGAKNPFALYCELMEEIKRRMSVIEDVTSARVRLPQVVALELCYLQLRMICELIALACLVAHGDIPETKAKRLTKSYNADQIIKGLSNLHPAFYPEPGRQKTNDQGRPIQIEKVTEPHLTKTEILRLYGECGDFLHKGNVESLLKGRRPRDFTRISDWTQKIRTLLNHHQIKLADPKKQLWVIMQAAQDGKVHAAEMEMLVDYRHTSTQ